MDGKKLTGSVVVLGKMGEKYFNLSPWYSGEGG